MLFNESQDMWCWSVSPCFLRYIENNADDFTDLYLNADAETPILRFPNGHYLMLLHHFDYASWKKFSLFQGLYLVDM